MSSISSPFAYPPNPERLGQLDLLADPKTIKVGSHTNLTKAELTCAEMRGKIEKQEALQKIYTLIHYPVKHLAALNSLGSLTKSLIKEGPFVEVNGEKVPVEAFSAAGLTVLRDSLVLRKNISKGFSLYSRYTSYKYSKEIFDTLVGQLKSKELPDPLKIEVEEATRDLEAFLAQEWSDLKTEAMELGIELTISTVPIGFKSAMAAMHDINIVEKAPISITLSALKWVVNWLYVLLDGMALEKATTQFDKHKAWIIEMEKELAMKPKEDYLAGKKAVQDINYHKHGNQYKEDIKAIIANCKDFVSLRTQLKNKGVDLTQLFLSSDLTSISKLRPPAPQPVQKKEKVGFFARIFGKKAEPKPVVVPVQPHPLHHYLTLMLKTGVIDLKKNSSELAHIWEHPNCAVEDMAEASNAGNIDNQAYLQEVVNFLNNDQVQDAMALQCIRRQEELTTMAKKSMQVLQRTKHGIEWEFTQLTHYSAYISFIGSAFFTAAAAVLDILLALGMIAGFMGMTSIPWVGLIILGLFISFYISRKVWVKYRPGFYNDLYSFCFYFKREFSKIGLALERVYLQRAWNSFIKDSEALTKSIENDDKAQIEKLKVKVAAWDEKINRKQKRVIDLMKYLEPMDDRVENIQLKDFMDATGIKISKADDLPSVLAEALQKVNTNDNYGKEFNGWLKKNMGIDLTKMKSDFEDQQAKNDDVKKTKEEKLRRAVRHYFASDENDLLKLRKA